MSSFLSFFLSSYFLSFFFSPLIYTDSNPLQYAHVYVCIIVYACSDTPFSNNSPISKTPLLGWLRKLVTGNAHIDLSGPDEQVWEQQLQSLEGALGDAGRVAVPSGAPRPEVDSRAAMKSAYYVSILCHAFYYNYEKIMERLSVSNNYLLWKIRMMMIIIIIIIITLTLLERILQY